jgi:ABC-type transport system involved in multi-copper enzyme maturation permease subunit
MRIFASTLRKLLRRPATWVLLGLLVALLGLILVAVGATANDPRARAQGEGSLLLLTFPLAYGFVLSFILGLGGLFAVIYGAAVAGSEWGWGTLKNAVARGESRSRYVVMTFVAVALLAAVGLLIAFAAGVALAAVGAGLAGISTAGMNDATTLRALPESLARGWLAIAEEGAIGFAIATVARSQLAGIGAGIGLFFGEQFARIFLSDIVKYLPFDAATAMAAGGLSGSLERGGSSLDSGAALVVVLAWLVGAIGVAALFTERAEIGG